MRFLIALLLLAIGCQAPSPTHDQDGHEHKAPHGGTLIVLGEEAAHLELVLSQSGRMTVYVLDAEAENSIRVTRGELTIQVDGKPILLKAHPSELTGEKVGDCSEFQGDSSLRDKPPFQGTVFRIEVQGRSYEKITFKYPEGNE
ncbi:hypothetical protein DYH09_20860 [bacterium CPR1]|nr:hypothetical protein [bacterium CPR1]